MSHQYLDDNDTLLVNKQLACAVGLNNSIILRQIHYWLCLNQKAKSERHFHDNCWWTFNTYDEWVIENFPFWSMDTVRRSIVELTDVYGLIEVGHYNERRGDQTKWYTINYVRYAAYIELWKQNGSPNVSDRKSYKAYIPIWQLAMGNFASCIGQDGKLLSPLPETIPDINPDKKDTARKRAKSSPSKKKEIETPITLLRKRLEPHTVLAAALLAIFDAGYKAAIHTPMEYLITLVQLEKYVPILEDLAALKATADEIEAVHKYLKPGYTKNGWTIGLKTIVEKLPAYRAWRDGGGERKNITGLWASNNAPEFIDVGLSKEERAEIIASTSTKKAVG